MMDTAARLALKLITAITLIALYAPLWPTLRRAFIDPSGGEVSFDRFTALFSNMLIVDALWFSGLAALLAASIATGLALLAAYSVRHSGLRAVIAIIMVLPLLVPASVGGLSSAIVFELVEIGPPTMRIIIAHTVWATPFAYLIVASTMASFDRRYLDAAFLCGASRTRAFFDIELPLIWPGVFGGFLFALIVSFNETIRASYLQGNTNTVQTYIWSSYLQVGLSPQVYALMALIIASTVGLVIFALLILLLKRSMSPRAYGH